MRRVQVSRVVTVALSCAALLSTLAQPAAAQAAKERPMSDDLLSFHADRNPPPDVEPVVRDGTRYEQHFGSGSDAQVGGLLTAIDTATGKTLWTLVVYDNKRSPELEGDVQDVFFREMHFQPDGKLLIVNERGERYRVDLDARTSELVKQD